MRNKKKPPVKKTHIEQLRPRPTGRGLNRKSNALFVAFKPFWARYKQVIIPCALFFILVGLFIFLYSRLVTSSPFYGFMAFTANVTGFLLNLTGRGVTVSDTVVFSAQFAFQIVDLCTAIMPMMILTAAVLAFPSTIKEKAIGLVVGLVGIFVVNEIRLVSLFFIGIYLPDIFETAHLLVWQSLMILLAIGLWLIWVYKYVRTTPV
jgi:archaeosortase B (VPXXXP-CTERM-specific)